MVTSQHYGTPEWRVEAAVERFLTENFADGDIVSHDWLRMTLEINDAALRMNEFVLLERMEQLKSALLQDHHVALQNVRGKGYRLVPPSEQAMFAAQEASRYIGKGLRKANGLLTHTRVDQLSDSERKRHTDTQVRIAGLAGMVSRGKRDVFKLFADRHKEPSG